MRVYRGLFATFAILVPSFIPFVADHATAGATPVPRLTVGDLTVAEGDSGKIAVRVPIDLDIPAPAKLTVFYRVSAGSATPGTDFVSPKSGIRTGKVAIGAKKTEAFVGVTIIGDLTNEPDDTVNIDVTSVAGATIARSHGTLTIQNDDPPAAALLRFSASGSTAKSAAATPALADATVPRLSVGTPVIWEGNSSVRHASVPLTLSIPPPLPVVVTFDTPGSDDSPTFDNCNDPRGATVPLVTKTVTFNKGQQSKYVLVPVQGNVAVGPLVNTVADSAAIQSGTATIADPTSEIVVMDDDGSNNVTPTPPPPGTYRVSEPADGSDPTFPGVLDPSFGCGYPSSIGASISADGRFVAFQSNADNLVGNDTNGYMDVFVKDTWTGDIQLISEAPDGTLGNGASQIQAISADGRYVAFTSDANNLVPGDDNASRDAFVYDRVTGSMRRLGDSHTSTIGSSGGALSADGRYVAFVSNAALTGGCGSCTSVFVLDQTTNVISLASIGSGGQMNGSWPAISGDGRHVAFVGLDVLGRPQMFERNLDAGTTEVVSVNNAGQAAAGTFGTYPTPAALSYDGRFVAFSGQYCNMGLASFQCGNGTQPYGFEIWLRDRVAHTTTVASASTSGTPIDETTDGPSLSADGRFVGFSTGDAAFAPECPGTNGFGGSVHMYERDLSTGTTTRVDMIPGSTPCPAEGASTLSNQALSSDGSYVAFTGMLGLDVSATNPEGVYVTRLR